MAKVTFTLEDTPNGTLIKSDPGLEQLVVLAQSDGQATNAHGYALVVWQAICEAASKGSAVKIH
ncbi:MAG: hypothetical protein ACXWTY_00645 [Methylobacter sp.]